MELFPGVPPTIKHIDQLKTTMKRSAQSTIILTASFYPRKVGESFANDTDATFLHLSTDVGAPGIETYAGLFDYLIEEITR